MADDLLRKEDGGGSEPLPREQRARPGRSGARGDLIDKVQVTEFEAPEPVARPFQGKGAEAGDIRGVKGFFEIVDAAPTHVPRNMFDQIKLYVNGTTYRVYFYDYKAQAWRFA